MYRKPFYKKISFWAAILLIIGAAVGAFFFAKSVAVRRAAEEASLKAIVESDDYWREVIDNGSYSEVIREAFESSDRYDLGHATWEYAMVDIDGDDCDELMIRVTGKSEGRANTFVLCRQDGKPVLAGAFEGLNYPLFSPSGKNFEAPSRDESRHHFYRIEGGECVEDFTLEESASGYKKDGESITQAEFSSYYSDADYLTWEKFTSKYIYSDISDSSWRVNSNIDPIGYVPEDFRKIIDGDLFRNGYWINGKIVRVLDGNEATRNEDVTVVTYDIFGDILDTCVIPAEELEFLVDITETSDGGFAILSVTLGNSLDSDVIYYYGTDSFAKYIVTKCGANGELEWRRPTSEIGDIAASGITAGDGLIYIGGAVLQDGGEPDEGQYDVALFALDEKSGETLFSKTLSGSGDEIFFSMTYAEDRLSLMVSSYSTDGDFEGNSLQGQSFELFLPRDLSGVITKRTLSNTSTYPRIVGALNGEAVHEDDGFDEKGIIGSVHLVIDYGDSYMTVMGASAGTSSGLSSSSIFLLKNYTVYTMHDKSSGDILWREAVEMETDAPYYDGSPEGSDPLILK